MKSLLAASLCLIYCFCNPLVAQEPITRSDDYPGLRAYFDSCARVESAAIPPCTKEIKKSINERIDSRASFEKDMIEYAVLVPNTELQKLLDSLLSAIVRRNNLTRKYRIFLINPTDMNAFSTGDGNIFIHLGLLAQIKQIDELTFTICHELAHDELDHSMKRYLRVAALENDKAFKEKIKELNKEEYNYREKATEILLSVMSKGMHFSREEELEADSLGMIYFMNTEKNSRSAYSLLKRLKADNYENLNALVDWPKMMEAAGLKAQEEWFGQERLTMQDMQWKPKSLPDSLLSHPNIELRIETLKRRYPGDTAMYKDLEARYQKMRLIAQDECLYSWIQSGDWDRAFYESCKMYQNGQRTFAPLALGFVTSRLLQARKMRYFGYFVSQESKENNPNFNQCLHFLNEVSNEDLSAFAEGILKTSLNFEPDKPGNFVSAAFYYLNVVKGDKAASDRWLDYAKKNFPQGLLKQRFEDISSNKKKK